MVSLEAPVVDALRRDAMKLEHLEKTIGLGTWEWTPATGELLWSRNLFRLYGLEPGEVTPGVGLVVSLIHPEDRERVVGALTDIAARGHRGYDLEYRFVRSDGALRAVRAMIATVEERRGGRRVIGSVQDVTHQRGLDRQLAAHVAVTRSLDDWDSFEPGAETLLRRLGSALKLAFAALWVPDGGSLLARSIWHEPSPALDVVAELTEQWRPGLGSAVIGRAFTAREPVVAPDPAVGGSPERNAAVRETGLRAALAVPAVSAHETLAVLELLSFEPVGPGDRLIGALDGIGHEIGHFLSHRRGELTEPVLTARQLELLELAARGRSAAEIASQLRLSPATVKRHFARAYRALGVSDRAAAVGEAMRRGLIG
jgi:PAS domain S-box-containing protein